MPGPRSDDPRPDTDERDEPGGTSSPGPHDLIAKPVTPGDDAGAATAAPGTYRADEPDD